MHMFFFHLIAKNIKSLLLWSHIIMPAPTGRRRHKTGYNVFQTHSLGKIRKLQLAVCFHWRLFLFALHKFVVLIVMMALRWAFKFVALKE